MPAASEVVRRRGSVMILTLWTVLFLGALAIAVGAYVDGAIQLASHFKSASVSYYLANAGVEKAIMHLSDDTNSWDGLTESWSDDNDSFQEIELETGFFSVSYVVPEYGGYPGIASGDEPKSIYGLTDEDRKININSAGEALLKSILEIAGELGPGSASDLAKKIVEWRSPKGEEMLTGEGGSRYYAQTGQGKRKVSARFNSIYELMLVDGVKAELVTMLEPHITVFSGGKININTADLLVLRALGGSSKSGEGQASSMLASSIIAFRQAGNVFDDPNPAAIFRRLSEFGSQGAGVSGALSGLLKQVTLKSRCFRGVATGKTKRANDPGNSIEFVYDRQLQKIVYWKEY